MTSKVYLVGAGPGDPGLLTVKALKLIQKADLIIYDTLANPDHLRHAKQGAVKICVGKRFRHHPFSQAKINRLIIRAARKNQTVVRLKGGDPYLFGRGGEEALFLQQHHVPFEVIPGVTSAVACAAYAGIPLTHREHSASVTFLTGHRAHDTHLDSIRWKSIVGLNGTVVIYMGFYNLGIIAKRLVENGMSPKTKVSVIEWGTLPRQKSCEGSLADIERRVKEKRLKAPCIIIVGEVVSLKEKLDWFEKLPLFGKKIVVTRTTEKAGFLSEKLSELGAEALEFPTIEIKNLTRFSALDQALRQLSHFDWLVFTSTYGVDAFFDRLEKFKRSDARALGSIKIASVGPQTSQALRERGIRPDLEPKRFETKALAEEFKRRFGHLKNKKILLLRANIAPPELEQALRKSGASVKRVVVYLTQRPRSYPDKLKAQFLAGNIFLVTFTSSSTVTNFVRILGLRNVKRIAQRTHFASIGPVTSKTLRSFGLRPSCEAKVYTTDGLVKAITSFSRRRESG